MKLEHIDRHEIRPRTLSEDLVSKRAGEGLNIEWASCAHLGCFFVLAFEVICRTVGTLVTWHLAAITCLIS